MTGLCRIARAGDGTDTVQVDGEALASPIDPWIGGSLHYEHRFADSDFGLTLRGGVTAGEVILDSGDSFTRVIGIVGLREHWGRFYFEASAGWAGLRRPRVADPEASIQLGVRWDHGPDFELEIGDRLGPVDLGLFAAPVGLGLRLGIAFGR